MENRAARLCTASNAFLLLAWCGSHTEGGAYSSFGRTSALYARALVFLRCDAESSAEEVGCSGGVTYYVGYVGAPSMWLPE